MTKILERGEYQTSSVRLPIVLRLFRRPWTNADIMFFFFFSVAGPRTAIYQKCPERTLDDYAVISSPFLRNGTGYTSILAYTFWTSLDEL